MQTGTLKMHFCRHGGSRVSCLSGLSVDEFQDLSIQFWASLKVRNLISINGIFLL